MKRPTLKFPVLVLCPALLVSCSNESSVSRTAQIDAQTKEFSEADKNAARVLSIGDEQSLQKISDPTARALACSEAIESMATKLRDANALTQSQLSALEKAREFYTDQVPANIVQTSSAEKIADETMEASLPLQGDVAKSGRTAIACIRRLQDS